MKEIRQQSPDWFNERFYTETVQPELSKSDSFTMEWHIKKATMIAALNYLRNQKKLKCQWIEKSDDTFLIQITNNTPTPKQ